MKKYLFTSNPFLPPNPQKGAISHCSAVKVPFRGFRGFTLYLLTLCLAPIFLVAQTERVSSPKSFNIVKEVKPPNLDFVGDIQFVEPSGNNAIDANENCKLVMKVKNSGTGDGLNCTAKITAIGATTGLTFAQKSLFVIKINETQTIEIPISSSMNTIDGTVEFTLWVDEPQGFGTDKHKISVSVKKFASPMVEVVDYQVTGDNGGELKKIQETKVSCNYNELFDYLKSNVEEYSLRMNSKEQTPSTNVSPSVTNWGSWKF